MPGRSSIEAEIRERAQHDPDFRARLIADPRAALAADHDLDIPESLTITVVEERSDEVVLVIPAAGTSVGELTDAELERSGGGWDWTNNSCSCPQVCP